jgi:phosphoribosyl 1,2-cyclic phosphodiesterase
LGSGSNGNATLIATEKVRLLVDIGFSFRETCKRLTAIGEDPQRIDAVLISHEHSDHVAGLPQLAKRLKAPIYLTGMTNDALDWNSVEPKLELFDAGQRLTIGDIDIDTFTVPHDAVDPVAFCFRSQGVKVGVVTDLGYMPESVRRQIDGCVLLIIESNHDLDMLKVGPHPWFVKQRVMSRVGHLSNEAVSDFLSTDFDRSTQVVILSHLSDANNHPAIARLFAESALEQVSARDTRIVVAEQKQPTEVFTF